MKFGLPMAVTLLLIQLAAAFCISQNQGAKIAQDLYTRGQGLVEAIAEISATFLINYDLTALEDIVAGLRRQEGVQWAVFFDAKRRPLTATKDMVQCTFRTLFRPSEAIFEEPRISPKRNKREERELHTAPFMSSNSLLL